MDAILEPNNTFDFEKLKLTSPVIVSGGNHFIKYVINNMPLYIQPPKCKVKQGILKAGKKMYCDLMFTIENETFIQWLENLEIFSKKYIFENREKWFETSLDEHDIENSFTSPLKLFKSGKYYIVRVNVPTILGKSNLKIYDEHENILTIEDVKEDSNICCILELQGIKCSPRSFQVEIELKQLLLLEPVDLFEKCILHTHTRSIKPSHSVEVISNDYSVPADVKISQNITTELENLDIVNNVNTEDNLDNNKIENLESNKIENLESDNLEKVVNPEIETFTNSNILEEVELNLEEVALDDKLFLKKRNDVYYEMYREALRKAKLAKDLALSSYLEATRIKNLYMLNDLNEESDFEEDNIDFIK
jgi:hypothetical protein